MNDNDIKKTIGNRLKMLRNELNLTQDELASKIGTVKGKSSIANYENGSNLPSDEVKLKMCELFDCTLDYLMCKSDIRNLEELQNIRFANAGGLDINDLDDDEIEEIKRQVEYMRWKKKNGNK